MISSQVALDEAQKSVDNTTISPPAKQVLGQGVRFLYPGSTKTVGLDNATLFESEADFNRFVRTQGYATNQEKWIYAGAGAVAGIAGTMITRKVFKKKSRR